MKLYNKYIFYKTAAAFLLLLALLVILIWFSRTVAFVHYITENGIELQQFSLLFVLILPWLLLFIVPISLFVAVLLVYNRLLLNNEIAILQNTGLTKLKIGKPAIVVALVCVAFCFLTSFYLMPLANKEFRKIRSNFEDNYSNLSFNKGTFEKLKSLTIYVREKNEQNQLFGILLNDSRNEEVSTTITAKQGNLKSQGGSLLLYMQNGTVQRFIYKENKEEILTFDNYVVNLSDNNKVDLSQKRWKPKERFLSELINPNDNSSEGDKLQYKIELQQRLTYPLMPLVLTFIALAFVLRGDLNRRGNNLNLLFAILMAISFLSITIAIYRMLEVSLALIPLLYLHFAVFFGVSYYMLKLNSYKNGKFKAKKN